LTACSDSSHSLSDFPYAGWIPTANGRLSFRHIGETRNPSRSIYANVATGASSRRYILGYQRRNLSDSTFRPIVDFLCGLSGDFWFVIAAQSTASPSSILGDVDGVVLIFKSKADWRRGPEQAIRNSIQKMNGARLSLDAHRDQDVEDAFQSGRNEAWTKADIAIKFSLVRSGEIYVSKPDFKDAELAYASKDFAERCGHDFEKWIADQGYFFMRDVAHRHQHHSPAVDTILILQKRTTDHFAWRRQVIFSLHYYIISARRTQECLQLIQATGVLAYCRAFVGICSRLPGAESLPVFEDPAIEASLSSQIQAIQERDRNLHDRATIISNERVLAVALLAPALALLGVFVQPRIGGTDNAKDFPRLNAVSDFIANNLGELVGALCLLYVVVVFFSWARHSKQRWYTRDILSLGVVNPIAAGALSILVGTAALLVGFYWGRTAIDEMAETAIQIFRAFGR
jgi:hypothetical protein